MLASRAAYRQDEPGQEAFACLNLCCCATNDPSKFPPLDNGGPQWRLNSAQGCGIRDFHDAGISMDRLTEMEAFATVVDQGGFTDAAKKLGISKSAVSKHVPA
jgi:hypothetical protein